jgi:hypothetical protein
MTTPLREIYNTLSEFRKSVAELKQNQKLDYDKFNKTNWQDTGIRDFADDLVANTVRFNVHVTGLEKTDVIESENDNKAALSTLAKNLTKNIAAYQSSFGSSDLTKKILNQLNEKTFGDILRNTSRPDPGNKPSI